MFITNTCYLEFHFLKSSNNFAYYFILSIRTSQMSHGLRFSFQFNSVLTSLNSSSDISCNVVSYPNVCNTTSVFVFNDDTVRMMIWRCGQGERYAINRYNIEACYRTWSCYRVRIVVSPYYAAMCVTPRQIYYMPALQPLNKIFREFFGCCGHYFI